MLDLKGLFEEAIKNATHDQDLSATLVKIAEDWYGEQAPKAVKMSPSQEAALKAASEKKQ